MIIRWCSFAKLRRLFVGALIEISTALFVGLIFLTVAYPPWCLAQDKSGSGNETAEEPLSEQVTDPLAYLTQVQIKDIYAPSRYGTNAQPNTVQIRPIFSIQPFWFIPFSQILRPTIRIDTTPDGKGASTTTAYNDMQLLDLFVMPWPNSSETDFRWGLGTYFVFPTSGNGLLGQGAWQMGPAAGFSYRGIPGLNLAGLMQQATSFAYTSSQSKPVTSITFQPIITYQLGNGWSARSNDATWTFNMRHNTPTTIPLSAGLGKTWEPIGHYALDTSVSGQWTVYRQFSDRSDQFAMNFTVSLLIPQLNL
jgi:hypothetical protein